MPTKGRRPGDPEPKRGRPVKYHTEAERKQAAADVKAKMKNITLDKDLVAALNDVADELEPKLGFRPTLSQTVRHLIRRTKAS